MHEVCLEEFCVSVYVLGLLIILELAIYTAVGLGVYKLYHKIKSKLEYKVPLNKKRKKSKN
tara:strand:- start:16 stop:198 length:183 start_codon:yes stop_codon:yes gene_type:complete